MRNTKLVNDEERRASRAAYMRAWKAKNKDRVSEINRKSHAKNREQRLSVRQAYYAKHKSEINAQRRGAPRKRYPRPDDYPAKKRASDARYRSCNKERINILGQNARARRRQAIGRLLKAEWDAIVARQRGRCFDCKVKAKLTIGHLVPLCRGGSNVAVNIVGQCLKCNLRQGSSVHPKASPSLFDSGPRVSQSTFRAAVR